MDDFDLQASLPFLISRVADRLAEAFTEELRPYDINIGMWRVLAVLRREPSIRMGELAQATCIEISTLSRQVTTMQRKGLLKRLRCEEDARAVELDLTPNGRALVERLIPLAQRMETAAVQDMTPSEVALFQNILAKIYFNGMDYLPKSKFYQPMLTNSLIMV